LGQTEEDLSAAGKEFKTGSFPFAGKRKSIRLQEKAQDS
jgi:hypothetical protein